MAHTANPLPGGPGPFGFWRKAAAVGVVVCLIVSLAVAARLIAVSGARQYRSLRGIINDGGTCSLSARTSLGLKFRDLGIFDRSFSWRLGIPAAAFFVPARSVQLYKSCTNADLERVGRLPWLTKLFILRSQVTDRGMSVVARLRRLKSLAILEVNITGAGLRGLSNLRGLQKLYLNKTGADDDIFGIIAPLDDLRLLSLAGDERVTGKRAEGISKLARLQYLALDGTHFSDAGLRWVGMLHDLRYLTLEDDNNITNSGLRMLTGLVKLRTLNLSGTQITNRAFRWIADMPSLRVLSLDRTHCTLHGIANLRRARPLLQVRHASLRLR